MTTKPQIYAIGTCALSIHASFLKTLSIYFYFLFFLLNSPEGVPRTVAKKNLRTMNLILRSLVRRMNEQFKLFIQFKPNLNIKK